MRGLVQQYVSKKPTPTQNTGEGLGAILVISGGLPVICGFPVSCPLFHLSLSPVPSPFLSVVVVSRPVWSSPHPICCRHPCPHSHSCPCPCSGPHTPPSTLQAVAHSGGGGCWVVSIALPLAPIVLVIPIPAAPCFHHVSNCSWWRFRM